MRDLRLRFYGQPLDRAKALVLLTSPASRGQMQNIFDKPNAYAASSITRWLCERVAANDDENLIVSNNEDVRSVFNDSLGVETLVPLAARSEIPFLGELGR